MSTESLIDENGKLKITLNPLQLEVFNKILTQSATLQDDCPEEISVFGGFGNGKSLVVMLITYILCRTYTKTKWIFCRATGPQLDDSVIAQFKDLFPEEISGYRFKVKDKEAHFKNGSIIFFRAFDGERVRRVLSTSYDGASICQAEEIYHTLFLQIFGRLRGKVLPKKILLLEGNPDDSWPKKRYIDVLKSEKKAEYLSCDCSKEETDIKHTINLTILPKEEHIRRSYTLSKICDRCNKKKATRFYIEATSAVNRKNLPDGYIDRLKANYPPEWFSRYVLSEWDKTTDKVWPEFKMDFHVVNPFEIKSHWYKAIAFDHGIVNPSAMLWGCVDENKNLYIYDEFYEKGQLPDDLVKANLKYGPIPTVADTSIKTPDKKNFGTLWDDLKRQGMNLVEAKKNKTFNILLVNQLLHQKRLFIFRNCVHLIEEIEGYKWKKADIAGQENRKEEVVKKDDHACDALQYLVRYLKDIKVIDPTLIPVEETLHHATVSYPGNSWEDAG